MKSKYINRSFGWLFVLIILTLIGLVSVIAVDKPQFDGFVKALHMVEASGRSGRILGDGKRSLGPLQISRAYWTDAIEFNSKIGGKYEDCVSLIYSKKVVQAYLQRYAAKAFKECDWKTCARIHNGGLDGHRQKATLKYWAKIQQNLKTN
jgi:hypothetical protein